ncbi:unnamed protein product, partial [Rotaria sordida]
HTDHSSPPSSSSVSTL